MSNKRDFLICCFVSLTVVTLSVFVHEYTHAVQCEALNGTPMFGLAYSSGYDFFNVKGTEVLPSPATYCFGLNAEQSYLWRGRGDWVAEAPAMTLQFGFIAAVYISIIVTWWFAKRRYNTVIRHTEAY